MEPPLLVICMHFTSNFFYSWIFLHSPAYPSITFRPFLSHISSFSLLLCIIPFIVGNDVYNQCLTHQQLFFTLWGVGSIFLILLTYKETYLCSEEPTPRYPLNFFLIKVMLPGNFYL